MQSHVESQTGNQPDTTQPAELDPDQHEGCDYDVPQPDTHTSELTLVAVPINADEAPFPECKDESTTIDAGDQTNEKTEETLEQD